MTDPQHATLRFLGAAGTVTGSKYLLTVDGRHTLIDAGMFQGEKRWRLKNREAFPVNPASIGNVLLTHAHADHSAYLPVLVKRGFRGAIWCTAATARLAEIVLRDAAKLQEQAVRDAKRGGWSKHEDPRALFTTADVEATLPLFQTVGWDANTDIDGVLWARWVRAGHILGSASIHVTAGRRSVLFSGDLGRHDHPVLKGRQNPPGANLVLVESTYGDREHPTPEVPHAGFADAVRRTVERGGQVLVPAFAIDRTEGVLRTLVQLRREARIPKDLPVIVDGPMSVRALRAYRLSPEEIGDEFDIGDFTELNLTETEEVHESKRINRRKDPLLIISSSGMLEGGRVLYHLERLLPDPRNTVILTGYQAPGTRGRQLLDGSAAIKVNGRYIPVRAEVIADREFSVHADASGLMEWLRALTPPPETVFVTHGEPEAALAFARRIGDELGWMAVVPSHGEIITIL